MLIDGKATAQEILNEIKAKVAVLPGRKPCLAVILAGENPSSHIYINRKIQACAEVGILSRRIHLPSTATEEEILQQIAKLNADPTIDGILVQLPLPGNINPNKISLAIRPEKDVDGFHPINVGKMLLGQTDGFLPCTPLGIMTLFERKGIEMTGKQVVVLGRSNIVGKPLAAMLMQSTPRSNATVTVIHSLSRNVKEICRQADVLIAALGKPRFVTADMVKEQAVVIDVGINRIDNPSKPKGYEIVGDVDFENVQSKCSWITPVPNGVGPMTIACLMGNTLKSYLLSLDKAA